MRPPQEVGEPRTVYVANYGLTHTGLILPTDVDSWIEYGYGDFDWFALGHDSWYDVFGTLCCPSAGALGRRELAAVLEADLREECGAKELLSVVVEGAAIAELVRDLSRRYHEDTGEPSFNNDLRLVKDKRRYHVFWNCNDEVANWLRRLGCEVCRLPILCGFRVQTPRVPSRRRGRNRFCGPPRQPGPRHDPRWLSLPTTAATRAAGRATP